MKYKMNERGNPMNPTAPKKLYATPVYDGMVNMKTLEDDLVLISALSRSDISSVLKNTLDAIPKYLLMGKSVQLGELGTLRISFSSEGVNAADEFNVGMIKGKRVIFTPGPLLRTILNDMKFEKQK